MAPRPFDGMEARSGRQPGAAPHTVGAMDDGPPPGAASRRSGVVGAMLGVGVMAAVDEIVFHQLLGWHHFYDRSTTQVGLVSDGLLHAVELLLLVAGLFLLADLARRGRLHLRRAWAGALLGAGGFQLFDGLVNHKVLRVHQVRYDVDLLPYDLAWNASALVLLAVGGALAVSPRGRAAGRRAAQRR